MSGGFRNRTASLFGCATLMVSLLLALPARADVYKCLVAGKTVYQDAPCVAASGTKLHFSGRDGAGTTMGGTAGAARVASGGSVAALGQQIERAEAESRAVHAAWQREVAALGARVRGLPAAQVDPQVKALYQQWNPRMVAADRLVDDLVDELHKRCPKGASGNSGQMSCLH